MAESFAFGITDRVLGKLGSAIIQEVGLAWGVKSELEDLRDTSSAIRALLLDAEGKQATNHQIRDWLGKLKDAFYDAEDIVDERGGVPLAVRSLGSLLNTKKDERDWVSIRESEIWKLEQDRDGIMAALRLSYYDLPHHLKQCLALCSLFPKGCEIGNSDLINFWMAQGLIQLWGQNATMEDIGETYINELLSRSFFQDVEEIFPGVIYGFKIHDLVHDLAIFFAQPEYFTLSFHSKDIPKRIQHVVFFDNHWPKEEYEAVRFLEKLNSSIRSIYFQMENM